MVYWVARAARQAREERGCKQVQVAATLDRDQSMIVRFEQGRSWPRDPDAIIEAYGKVLDIPPQDIWKRALELWGAANGNGAG